MVNISETHLENRIALLSEYDDTNHMFIFYCIYSMVKSTYVKSNSNAVEIYSTEHKHGIQCTDAIQSITMIR